MHQPGSYLELAASPQRRARALTRIKSVAVLAFVALGIACHDVPTSPPPVPAEVALDHGPGASHGLHVGSWTWVSCQLVSSLTDRDRDGVHDGCENALAQEFAPELIVQPDCVYDVDVVGPNGIQAGPRVGGDYGYAVQRVDTVIRLAYLPAYYYDCGSGGEPHSGDSELILLDISFDEASEHWRTQRVFLSSHCGEEKVGFPVDFYCKWYPANAFQFANDISLGAPEVWVSMWKHANYPSQSACNEAYDPFIVDECPSSSYAYRFPASFVQQNIGSADYPHPWRTAGTPFDDCQPPLWQSERLEQLNPLAYSTPYRECWWTQAGAGGTSLYFDGWIDPLGITPINPDGNRAVAYGTHLENYAGFAAGQSIPPGAPTGLSIAAPPKVKPFMTCGFAATTELGTPPFTFEWYVNDLFTGETGFSVLYANPGYNFTIRLVSVDATGKVRQATKSVIVSPTAPMCPI